jgi:hypothetical protein
MGRRGKILHRHVARALMQQFKEPVNLGDTLVAFALRDDFPVAGANVPVPLAPLIFPVLETQVGLRGAANNRGGPIAASFGGHGVYKKARQWAVKPLFDSAKTNMPIPKTKPYPLRFSEEQKAKIDATSIKLGLFWAETARQAINLGLPILEKRLATKEVSK